jgi:uncharacterized protein YndB with AHSA1/START domain
VTTPRVITPDPELDLVLQREIDVPRDLVWKAWTTAENLKMWFTPAPWSVSECTIDLRPGGTFRTVMRSPDGSEFPNVGCFLEIVPNELLIWSDALLPGFRPAEKPFMTGVLQLEALGDQSTRYTAMALHRDEASKKRHEEMGFHQGWSKALDQLVAHVKAL